MSLTEVDTTTADELGLTGGILGTGRGRHAFEDAVERLAMAIRLGVFPDGSSLPPERELAGRLGVSRATLREAIAALRAAGMVRTTRGRGGGTVVDYRPRVPGENTGENTGEAATDQVSARRTELLDSLVFRRVLEPGACQLAASRQLGPDQQDQLQLLLSQVSGAADPAEHRQADSRLHLAIASVTGSAQLVDAITRVQADLHVLLTAIPVLPTNIDHSTQQHRTIVGAILEGDQARARRVMEDHCDDTAALLRGLLS